MDMGPSLYNPKESILISIKKLIGFGDDYNAFDYDLIIHINSMFGYLRQLGVGIDRHFYITGANETWEQFWGGMEPNNMAITLLYQKTKITFDPPTSGVLHEALERQIKENEWRLWMESEERRRCHDCDGCQCSEKDDEDIDDDEFDEWYLKDSI